MRRRAAILVLALGEWVACARRPEPPADFAEQLAAFRTAHDAEIAAPAGPLSAVAVFYLEGERTVGVLPQDDGVFVGDESLDAPLRFRIGKEGIACTKGCGDAPVVLDTAREIPLPPYLLTVGPQPSALRILVHDPEAHARRDFRQLSWLPPDASLWLAGRLHATPDAGVDELTTSRGTIKPMRRVGTVHATLPDGTDLALLAYEEDADTLLVPFADATNGDRTYDAGRYLQVDRPAAGDDDVILDFNRATNPWCAYSEHYNCPIPPPENRVGGPIAAGEARWP